MLESCSLLPCYLRVLTLFTAQPQLTSDSVMPNARDSGLCSLGQKHPFGGHDRAAPLSWLPLKCQDTDSALDPLSNLIAPPGQPRLSGPPYGQSFPGASNKKRELSLLRSHLELSSTSIPPLPMRPTPLASPRADSPTSQVPGVICSSTLSRTPSRQPQPQPPHPSAMGQLSWPPSGSPSL